ALRSPWRPTDVENLSRPDRETCAASSSLSRSSRLLRKINHEETKGAKVVAPHLRVVNCKEVEKRLRKRRKRRNKRKIFMVFRLFRLFRLFRNLFSTWHCAHHG